LNTQDPVLSAELAGGPPASVYGYLANALAHRMGGVNQPITILCCDNIRSNGRVLERNFMTYLEARELFELAKWVGVNVTFPCSMVDRITPRASKELEAETSLAFPGLDLSPIHGESFLQWVLEDRFAADMPNLSVAGVQIVADPELGVHFDLFETQNVLPGLSIDLPFDGHEYLEQITARFKNRAIADSLERICMDGWSKMQIFLRPTLEGCLAQGIAPAYTYECAASWYVYARRIAAGTMKIPYHEPYWDSLAPLLAAGQENAFATCSALWVDLPERYTDFVPDLVTAIRKMEEKWPA
jgi:D-arabinitol 4-dehydrogenase